MWGKLGLAEGIPELWREFDRKTREAKEFGWGKLGIGGNWSLAEHRVAYVTKRPHMKEAQQLQFISGATFVPNTEVIGMEGSPVDDNKTLRERNDRFFVNRYQFPQGFFDWGKKYLFALRKAQPSFDAPAVHKVIWCAHVAWTINMMLGATNVHGSVLSMALYEEATGKSFSDWAEKGSYMFPVLHNRALPEYFFQAVDETVSAQLSSMPSDVVIEYGLGKYDKKLNRFGESLWRGGPWALPFETRRYRWAGTHLQGFRYGLGQVNDPFYPIGEDGSAEYDGGHAIQNYTRWAYAIPWILGIQAWGKWDDRRFKGAPRESMVREAVLMSTFFYWQGGDQGFWNAVELWPDKAEFVRRDSWGRRPRYMPNNEFSFRYYYPGMIDLLLQCDYASLVSKALNIWWRFNIGALSQSDASFALKPDVEVFDSEGEPRRDQYGARVVPLVATAGYAQDSYDDWKYAKSVAKWKSARMNIIRSVIAIIQAVYGNYGGLGGAVKGWIQHATDKYPKPSDHWKGVAPILPVVMRQAPQQLLIGSQSYGPRLGPDTGGFSVWSSVSIEGGVKDPNASWITGTSHSPKPTSILVDIRDSVMQWGLAGTGFKHSEDALDLVATPKPNRRKSPSFPALSAPGEEISRQALPLSDPLETPVLPPLVVPADEDKPSRAIWWWLIAALGGSYAVYRSKRGS